jgi:hypothetical protein
LIHGYDAVDLDILWQVIQQDLPGWPPRWMIFWISPLLSQQKKRPNR